MRTPMIVCLSVVASAAIAAPTAIVAHDVLSAGGSDISSAFHLPSSTPSSNNGDTNQGGANGADAATNTGSGTSTRATSAQEQGVVMIDTVTTSGEGAGSGMVLTSDGTVLTNYHVVNGSTMARVKVPNGGTYTADVVGHDQAHDVAVLKLRHASGLKTVSLDKEAVRSNESVLAVGQGNGEGVLYAATGTVSATNSQITAQNESSLATSETLTGLIKTNAPIVPGYSGGPLFDTSGKVVGINTAASASNSLTGYNSSSGTATEGFAIPIQQAKSIADDIIAGKKTSSNHIGKRASLGVAVSVPQDSTSGPNAGGMDGQGSAGPASEGVVVRQVIAGQGAAAAGLAAGDTITSVAGHTINSGNDLSSAMDAQYPGAKVTVKWITAMGVARQETVTLSRSSTN